MNKKLYTFVIFALVSLFSSTAIAAQYELVDMDNVLFTETTENINAQYGLSDIASIVFTIEFATSNNVTVSNNYQLQDNVVDVEILPALIGPLFNNPNPYRKGKLTQIGYRLSTDMEITIHAYDMVGFEVFKETYSAGMPGGSQGYNKVTFSPVLNPGVYLYVLTYQNKVLGKSKMMVQP